VLRRRVRMVGMTWWVDKHLVSRSVHRGYCEIDLVRNTVYRSKSERCVRMKHGGNLSSNTPFSAL